MGASAVSACALQESKADVADAAEVVQGIARRTLGRTGAKVSIVGYPGFALQHEDQEACTASLRRAFDNGINYFDVAPAYANGLCENRMGLGCRACLVISTSCPARRRCETRKAPVRNWIDR